MGNLFSYNNLDVTKSRESKNKITTIQNDPDTMDYFKLIKLKLRKIYEENENNLFNLTLSLDKKDFISISSSRRISANNDLEYIYWKDYLINYLKEEDKKGEVWCNDLIAYIYII
jgi:hypothetical protein